MDRQTKIGPNGMKTEPKIQYGYIGPTRRPGGLAHHLIELGELQLKLLRTDVGEATQAAKIGTILMALSVVLLIAVIPILLLALTLGIEELFDLSRGVSLLITAGIATLLGIGLLWAGWNIVLRGAGKISRSRVEFKKNVKWLKQLVSPNSDQLLKG
jgi:hypothetical protein